MTLDEFHPDTTWNPSPEAAIRRTLYQCGIEGEQATLATQAALRIVSDQKPTGLPIYPTEQYEAAAELVCNFIGRWNLSGPEILMIPAVARLARDTIDRIDRP